MGCISNGAGTFHREKLIFNIIFIVVYILNKTIVVTYHTVN